MEYYILGWRGPVLVLEDLRVGWYVVWSRIPRWVLIGSNRHCSSVMETQLSVHHHSLITGTRGSFEKVLDMKFHDLNTDHGRFICGSYEVLYVEVKNFVRAFT